MLLKWQRLFLGEELEAFVSFLATYVAASHPVDCVELLLEGSGSLVLWKE